MDINCETCEKSFSPIRPSQKYCSKPCARAARPRKNNKIRYECLRCGVEFFRGENEVPGKYCSHSCAGKSRTGELSSRWKGGRIVNGEGYIMIKQPDGKYKMEHRIVLEEKIGRLMFDTETVHHRNGIRDDNRPENLELRTGRHGKGASQHCPTCTCETI